MVATADDNTKTLTVRQNGEVIKTMPISMGKNNTPTNNGVYIVGDRFSHMIMDSSTYGVPSNSPRMDIAPRSTGRHRCPTAASTSIRHRGRWAARATPTSVTAASNVSPSNAQWFFNNTKRGDIVEVRNTVGSTLSGTEGLGDWNIPWEQWESR